MFLQRLLRHRTRRFGAIAVALAFLVQTFAVASMPLMHLSADEDMVVICTSSGMKTVPLAQFLGSASEQDLPAPDTASSDGTCVLCLLAHQVALMPAMAVISAIDLNAHAPQAPPVNTPRLNGFRRTQQARAPPSNA